jgi:hypothetical protein
MLGTLPFIVAGTVHAILALLELVGPFMLAPTDLAVRRLMAETPFRLTTVLRLDTPIGATGAASMWRGYVGFNLTHSVGLLFFGFVLFLLARNDFDFVVKTRPMVPLALGLSLIYFLVSLGFFFYLPAIVTGLGLVFFLMSLLTLKEYGLRAGERG